MHRAGRVIHARAPRAIVALVAVAAFASALHASPPARGDDANARAARAFAEGERAFAATDYGRAAALFEEANAASPRLATLWNAARSRHLGGELAKAANLYTRFLRASAEAKDHDDARAALATIERYLGRLTVKAPDDARVSVDGAPTAGGALVYVDPGEHRVASRGDAGGVQKTVRVAAGEAVVVELASPPAESSPHPPRVPPRAYGEHRSHGVPPIVPVVAGAATLAVTGVAVWSGLDLLAQRRRWDQTGTNADLDVGLDKQTRTNALIGVALGLGVVTGVLALLTDWQVPLLGGDASTRAVGLRF